MPAPSRTWRLPSFWFCSQSVFRLLSREFQRRSVNAPSASDADEERLSYWHALGLPWTKFARLAIFGVAVAGDVVSYRDVAPSSASHAVVAERAAAVSPMNAVSIAVLSFLNLSGVTCAASARIEMMAGLI